MGALKQCELLVPLDQVIVDVVHKVVYAGKLEQAPHSQEKFSLSFKANVHQTNGKDDKVVPLTQIK